MLILSGRFQFTVFIYHSFKRTFIISSRAGGASNILIILCEPLTVTINIYSDLYALC